ncbi:hypothetical protein FG385_32830 [Amycolatopsis alkalitolerans]|uniref:Uncharacterized protein n=2 Tax=Amycolatopsis alkalitolerans TaxID=2547244 RepID=A0A5C4LQW0_9PSEU|nr:hypothetical protein FG385_32830 [Amycolatopsis alkalitolerans]
MMKRQFSDDQHLAYMATLQDLECAGQRFTGLEIGPMTGMYLIGALQLVLRHPAISVNHRHVLTTLIESLRPLFHEPVGQELIDLGYEPAADRKA